MKREVDNNAPAVERQQILIEAPPEKVWAVLTGINAWPSWQADVTEAVLDDELAEGSVFKWKGGGVRFVSTLHTVEPHRALGWTGTTFGASAIHNWKFNAHQGGTMVTVEESLDGFLPKLFRSFFTKNLKKGMEKSLHELKAKVEA